MLFKKNVVLRDGPNVLIESSTGKENAQEFQRFTNTLTKEGTYLLVNKQVTFKEIMVKSPGSSTEKKEN